MNLSADISLIRYWKLSLMVHPDKCSHPEAQQAFVKLNKAFKDLQDPVKVRFVKFLVLCGCMKHMLIASMIIDRFMFGTIPVFC